jgi:hypothetical protein
MTKYLVRKGGDTAVEVMASAAIIEPSGVLAFYDESNRLIKAYAPGSWTTVSQAGQ